MLNPDARPTKKNATRPTTQTPLAAKRDESGTSRASFFLTFFFLEPPDSSLGGRLGRAVEGRRGVLTAAVETGAVDGGCFDSGASSGRFRSASFI